LYKTKAIQESNNFNNKVENSIKKIHFKIENDINILKKYVNNSQDIFHEKIENNLKSHFKRLSEIKAEKLYNIRIVDNSGNKENNKNPSELKGSNETMENKESKENKIFNIDMVKYI